jgi:hypothetical protein
MSDHAYLASGCMLSNVQRKKVQAIIDEHNATYVTKTGRVLTAADIEALAEEAERGYDVSHLAPPKEVSAHEQAIMDAEAHLAELDEARTAAYRAAERAEGDYLDAHNALTTLRRSKP